MSDFMGNYDPREMDYNNSRIRVVNGNAPAANFRRKEAGDKSGDALYISNIPKSITKDNMMEYMKGSGHTPLVVTMLTKRNQEFSKQCAIVKINNQREGLNIIEKLNNKGPLFLNISFARKNERSQNSNGITKQTSPSIPQTRNHNGHSQLTSPRSQQNDDKVKMDVFTLREPAGRGKMEIEKREEFNLRESVGRGNLSEEKCNSVGNPSSSGSSLKDDKEENGIFTLRKTVGRGKMMDIPLPSNMENRFKKSSSSVDPIGSSMVNGHSSSTHPTMAEPDPSCAAESIRSLGSSNSMKRGKLTACIACGDVASRRCSVCKAGYCSITCQQNDWFSHKSMCEPPPPLEDMLGNPVEDGARISSSSTKDKRSMPVLEDEPDKSSSDRGSYDTPDCRPAVQSVPAIRQNVPPKPVIQRPLMNGHPQSHQNGHQSLPTNQRLPQFHINGDGLPMNGAPAPRLSGGPPPPKPTVAPPVPKPAVAPPAPNPTVAPPVPKPTTAPLAPRSTIVPPVSRPASGPMNGHPSGKQLPQVNGVSSNEPLNKIQAMPAPVKDSGGYFDFAKQKFVPMKSGRNKLIVRDVSELPYITVTPESEIGLSNDLVSLSEKMQVHCNGVKESYLPTMGEMILAKFPEDNQWYRATASDITAENEVEVMYVDYGNMHVIGKEDIIKMKAEFMDLPILAITAKIDGIKSSLTEHEAEALRQVLPVDTVITVDVRQSPDGSWNLDNIVSHESALKPFLA